MDELISVVIPVYNVEAYLEECLDSIINQTYSNLEILLINDGSLDNSKTICEKYEQRDSRIKLINKENGGLSDARNVGINNATGKWITFVDSDDVITQDYCELMLCVAQRNKNDLVVGDFIKAYSDDVGNLMTTNELQNADFGVFQYSTSEAILEYYYRKLPGYAWAILIRFDVIKNLRFPVGRGFEDAYFVPRLLENVRTISYIKRPVYIYRQRKGSIVNSKFSKTTLDQYYMVKDFPANILNYNEGILTAIESKQFISGLDVLRKVPVKERRNYPELYQIQMELMRLTRDVKSDHKNTRLVRALAWVYSKKPSLAINLCKIRKYIKVKRV